MSDDFSATVLTRNAPSFPWYKQKVFFKAESKKKKQLCGALDGHRWRFVNARLDDFRNGYPLEAAAEEIFLPSQCKTAPIVFGKTGSASSCPSLAKAKNRLPPLSKEQVCFSKENPLKQMRSEQVEAVEAELRKHPLALYPHLETGMAAELFDEVLLVLDPDMDIQRTFGHKSEKTCQDVGESENTPQEERDGMVAPVNEIPAESKKKNIYRTTFKDTQKSWDDEDQGVSVKGLRSPSQDEDIKKVTKNFCDWVASLGGNSKNLTESTLLGLFVSGYEKKPSLIFPIEVVKPSNVPEELRGSGMVQRRMLMTDLLLKDSDTHEAGRRKLKYGAWYLDTKLWKARPAKEPLRDTFALEEDMFFPEKPGPLDDELKQLHGTQALKQFITSRGLRTPRFLKAVMTDGDREKTSKVVDKTTLMPVQRGTHALSA